VGGIVACVVGDLLEPRQGSLFVVELGVSRVALEVLAIIAYRQPIARAGIELIRGSVSDSALDTLLDRTLIERNAHQLFVTTQNFLDLMGLRDLVDLPPLVASRDEELEATRLLDV
jgi:segregation and condensation protein B